jgi:ribosomal protein S18 acetylase RimI-like enzyme
MLIRPFHDSDTDAVVALWTAAGLVRPWNDPRADIRRKLTVQPELFLIGELEGAVVGSAMVGYDGHRGSVYYLAVDPAHQGRGFGNALMAETERLLTELGCPKIHVMIRADNKRVIGFYRGLAYGQEQAETMGKRLILDES